MVKKLAYKAIGLIVFVAVLLMPFSAVAAIPAKPAVNGTLIAGDPIIPEGALYGGAPYYIYDKAANTLTSSAHSGVRHYVDFPLDASLTADSSYVISVGVSLPEDARYDANYRGPIFIFRKNTDGNYLGLWMQNGATYFGTFTKAADGSLGFSQIGSIDNCLPSGFTGTLKIYSTPSSVRFSVYDTNGNPVNLTYGGGHVIGAEHGWDANYVKGGEPAFGVSTDATKVTFSNLLVYSPIVEGNLVTGAPTIPADASVYSYDSATGILSAAGQPGTKWMIEYPLSADLKAKDTYKVSLDYKALNRYDVKGCGPYVIYRKTNDGRYLGLFFAENEALYHGYFTLDANTSTLSFSSAGSIIDPLVDGTNGSIVIESTPTKTILSVLDDQGNPVTLQYSYNGIHDIGSTHTLTYDNIGAPALGVTFYGTGAGTTISNVVVLSDTVDDNTIEVGAVSNGTVTVDGSVNVNDVQAGSTVNLTVAPVEGYQLKAGSLCYTVGGKTYPITTRVGAVDGAGNTFAFVMPEGNVTLSAEFVSANDDNMATLGASFKGNDLRFVGRVYRNSARGTLVSCGNYLLRKDSELGAKLADKAALTDELKADLLAAVAGGSAHNVATTKLLDRCGEYVDFAVRINGAGQETYKNDQYVCVSYATYSNGETIYGNACVRSYADVAAQ